MQEGFFTLFKGNLGAFICGKGSKIAVLLSGLTDGLWSLPYSRHLADSLRAKGWILVQPILRSSYLGYGTSSLKEDAEDIHALLRHLSQQMLVVEFALIGHSTGCQDILYYLNHFSTHHQPILHQEARNVSSKDQTLPPISAAVLQGPVSDRQFMSTLPETAEYINLAKQYMENGDGEHLLPRAADVAPITASRYLSLADKGGLDDMFSSDLTKEELISLYGSLPLVPLLFVHSLNDEYVPKGIDVHLLSEQILEALPEPLQRCSKAAFLNNALHDLQPACDVPSPLSAEHIFTTTVSSFLSTNSLSPHIAPNSSSAVDPSVGYPANWCY
eukprot:GCRY01006181.1.p1 GENE.GCRY01006181.1~~GCRY01006181.1.p1  ORF type:complete len:330 (+),score=49.04 GCRY01006181.1:66-1055(+)